MAFEDGNLVNADLCHIVEAAMGKAVIDDKLDCPKYAVPTGFEDIGRLLPLPIGPDKSGMNRSSVLCHTPKVEPPP